MNYIGLDCHKQYDHATMIDTETGERESKRLAHTKKDFSDFIGDRAGSRMVIDSCQDWSRRRAKGNNQTSPRRGMRCCVGESRALRQRG